jgi:WD40 repeat protein
MDVKLPPWAQNVHDFIRIHRAALESDYVSEHLHHWIDLIWGYKQRGEEAVRAKNLFYFLTYEDEINIDTIQDPVQKQSIEDQINNFGQTPSQLLKKPHPKRCKRFEFIGSNIFDKFNREKTFLAEGNFERVILLPFLKSKDTSPKQAIPDLYSGQLIGIDENLNSWVFKWRINTKNEFICDPDSRSANDRKIPIFLPKITPKSFIVNHGQEYIIVIGCPDRSFKIISNLDQKPTVLLSMTTGHSDIITCAALSEDDRYLVTGSLDSNVVIWKLGGKREIKIQFTIFGHEKEITAVDISRDNDIIVSASKYGKILVHSLFDESLIRAFSHTEDLNITQISINSNCEIVFSSISAENVGPRFSTLHLYSCNGQKISKQDFGSEIVHFTISRSGSHIIVCDSVGSLSLHFTHNFSHIHTFMHESNIPVISTMLYSPDERFLHVSRQKKKGDNAELVLISTDLIISE